jgi:hypothetical protein
MAFWSDNTLDPKRQFKFKVTFGATGASPISLPYYMAQSADRPTYKISDSGKIDFLDKVYHYPGKVTWEPVKIKFVDAVADDNVGGTQLKVYNYLLNAGWIDPNQAGANGGNLASIGKPRAVIPLINIETLNSKGQKIDKFQLNNAFVTSFSANGLAYASEEILTLELTLRYDWASLVQ